MIKALTFTFIFVSGVILFSNCEDENANPRSYPRVNTLPVTNISEKGASFSAELYSLGTEKIIEHGFVWGTTEPTLSYSNRVYLGPCDNAGKFQSDVTTSLKKDIKYNVKPFIQTADHIVYGNPVVFKSLGSGAPVIEGFEPHSAAWLDTITITGKNFSWAVWDNDVKLNQIKCSIMNSTDTTIQVTVPSELSDLKSIISVDLAGNTAVQTRDTFRLIAPVIKDFLPKQVRWGDTITVTGTRFLTFGLYPYITATLGGFPSAILEMKKESFKIIVPLEIASESNLLNIKIQNQIYTLSEKVNLLSPLISGIRPKEGTWGTEVTLKGKFHPSVLRNAIKIGGYTATIVSNNKDSIRVKIPQNLSTARSVFYNSSSPFNIASADTFKLFGPVIESITPLAGPSNTYINITGKYLHDPSGRSIVKFGTVTQNISGQSGTILGCYVPVGIGNGPVSISVGVSSQISTYPTPFVIKNPVITTTYPLSGTYNDLITIEGENLLSGTLPPDVYFTNNKIEKFATIISSTANKIVVRVPSGIDSIPQKIKLNYRAVSYTVYSTDNFILSPPVITSASPSVLVPGFDITINGNNFDPIFTNNQVFWEKYPLKVRISSSNTIIATVPTNIPRGFNNISIISGGYRRTYTGLFESRSAWTEINVPSTLNLSKWYGAGFGFSIKGLGYIIDPSNKMSSYNPATKEFTDLGSHPEFKLSMGYTKVINNDTLYAIGTSAGGFYRYDTGSNLWIYVGIVPSNFQEGIAFSLNGQLYYGMTIISDYYAVDLNILMYDQRSKTWVHKNRVPYISNQRAVAYFTIGNRGYVLQMDKTFTEYNPDTDSWRKLASYPGPGINTKGLAFFVLNNKGYVGLGRSDLISTPQDYSDFWSYNPSTDSWTPAGSIPYTGRFNSTSFVITNKLYIGLGTKDSAPIRDFYEFDPAFISK